MSGPKISKGEAPRRIARPSLRFITGVVEQPAAVSGSQNWRSWAVEPGAIDPARAEYIDNLLAKLRERQASRG